MSNKKAKKGQDKRIPAEKLLLDFIKANRIVLIVDEIFIVNTDAKDALYTKIRRPMLKAFYLDQVAKNKPAINGESKPKINIVN